MPESCLRCHAEIPDDEINPCDGCGFSLCASCERWRRCGRYEIHLSLYPETARRYYSLLDDANAGRVDTDEIEAELCELEAAMA